MDGNSRYDSLLNWSLYVSVFPSSPSSSFCAASTYFAPSGETISTLDLKIGWSLTNWTKIQSSTSVPIKMLHFFSTHLATTIVDKYSATNVIIHFCFAISCPPLKVRKNSTYLVWATFFITHTNIFRVSFSSYFFHPWLSEIPWYIIFLSVPSIVHDWLFTSIWW